MRGSVKFWVRSTSYLTYRATEHTIFPVTFVADMILGIKATKELSRTPTCFKFVITKLILEN